MSDDKFPVKTYDWDEGCMESYEDDFGDYVETDDYKALQTKLSRLEKALKIYADKNNWLPTPNEPHEHSDQDWWQGPDDHGWEIAQQTLNNETKP